MVVPVDCGEVFPVRSHALLPCLMILSVVSCADPGQLSLLDRRTGPGPEAAGSPVKAVVLDERGLPASRVQVRVFPSAPDVSTLISERGAGLISNASAGLVSNSAAGLVSNSAAGFRLGFVGGGPSRRVQAGPILLETDENGRFSLASLPATGSYNIEAVRSANSKAIAQNVAAESDTLSLTLAPTGGILGTVSSDVPQVTDLLGIQVFVPGTDYVAVTDASGSFRLSALPVGTFDLVAIHPDLGRGFLRGVKVQSGRVTESAVLDIHTVLPSIRSLSASVVAPGQNLTLQGSDFGVSRGKRPSVTLGGITCQVLEQSDTRLVIRVPDTDRPGEVVVRVGELSSDPVAVQVAARLELAGAPGFPAPLTATSDIVATGVSRLYEARVLDRTGAALAGGQVSWSVTGQSATVTGGRLTGQFQGQSVVTATMGSLAATLQVQITPPVVQVAILPDPAPELVSVPIGEVALRPGNQALQLEAFTTYRGDTVSSVQPVRWDTTEGSLVSVEPTGLVRVQPGAPAGKAVVRAVSVADPSKQATLSVPVVRLADLSIVVE